MMRKRLIIMICDRDQDDKKLNSLRCKVRTVRAHRRSHGGGDRRGTLEHCSTGAMNSQIK